MSLTDRTSLSLVQAAADEALEGRQEKLAWHVRRAWSGGVEVLIKRKGDYSEIDILEGLEDVKTTLSSKFFNYCCVTMSFVFLPLFFFFSLNYVLISVPVDRYENRGFRRTSDRCRFAG